MKLRPSSVSRRSVSRRSVSRRLPRLTMRVRMTALVGLAAALVLVPAAVFGPIWVEYALLNDVFDDEAALQSQNIEPLLDRMDQSDTALANPATQPSLASSSDSQSNPQAIAIVGLSASEALYMQAEARHILRALSELDRLGHLDDLLQITDSTRESGVPVVMSTGVVAAFSLRDPTVVTVIDSNPPYLPVITVFGLNDLVYKLGGFELLGVETQLSGFGSDIAAPQSFQQIAFASRNTDGTAFVVAADIGNVIRSIDRIQAIMWVVIPLAVLAVVLLAWLLTGRALRPVEQITEQVEEINAGTLGDRVPQPGTGDEIDRLATTMNTMLNRLEHNDTRLRQFVSDASHELRTPVAVLRSEAELALKQPQNASAGELATGVLGEAERLQRIVDDLLVLARHDENSSPRLNDAIDLDDIVLAEGARSRAVAVDMSGVSAGRVNANPETASRIVAHLLDNATHHAQEGVAVTLVTEARPSPDSTAGANSKANSKANDKVVLCVDDDGPGIGIADRQRIFERFTRLSEARSRNNGGAGLGLAVVKALVSELGGEVTVADSPLGGARFIVTLPHATP